MASLVLCNRASGKAKRLRVEGINLTENVAVFRAKSAAALGVQKEEIDLIYCGHNLKDGQSLESYGVKPGVTVHVLKRKATDLNPEPEKLGKEDVLQVVTALQAALLNPAYRQTVERMLNDQEALENIMAATPGLHSDPVAIAILQDPEMMALLADPQLVHGLIEAHPALGHAAMLVAAAVNEEGAKAGSGMASATSTGTYSMDQMSDDEDLEGAPVSLQQAAAQARQPQTITQSQFLEALAAVTGVTPPPQQQSSTGSSSSGGSTSSPSITADFFRQALGQTAGVTPPQPPQQSEEATQAQLAQLRDMGITDEAAARQALMATNGNIQAALDLLFGDGMET